MFASDELGKRERARRQLLCGSRLSAAIDGTPFQPINVVSIDGPFVLSQLLIAFPAFCP
jgi:hypothetical protein